MYVNKIFEKLYKSKCLLTLNYDVNDFHRYMYILVYWVLFDRYALQYLVTFELTEVSDFLVFAERKKLLEQ